MSIAGEIETSIQECMEWNLVEEYKEVSHWSAEIHFFNYLKNEEDINSTVFCL